MTGESIDSYVKQGDTITLDKMDDGSWVVTCVTEEGSVHWALNFSGDHGEAHARVEFERWR